MKPCLLPKLLGALLLLLTAIPNHSLLTRWGFIGQFGFGVPLLVETNPSEVKVPLRFLPIAGCLALQVDLRNGGPSYYATVDTGSPFLTAPPVVENFSSDVSLFYPPTTEQYGESVGSMSWRQADVEMQALQASVILGIVPPNVLEETGGLFVGLIASDDFRPTVLKQLGYMSFVLDYGARSLTLSKSSLLNKAEGHDLFSLSPWGPNLYHYAVQCHRIELQTPEGWISPSLSRPVIVVIDTGLTGCILSDSWREDLPVLPDEIRGALLDLGDSFSPLVSDPAYWKVDCFRLPWFPSTDQHPHIIAAGATFLSGSQLTVDTRNKRVRLIPRSSSVV